MTNPGGRTLLPEDTGWLTGNRSSDDYSVMLAGRRRYIAALYGFDAVVQRADPGSWRNQSPCERWKALHVVDHNAQVCRMIAAMARGEDAVVPTGDPRGVVPSPVDGYDVADNWAKRLIREPDEVVPVWNTCRNEVLEALDADDALTSTALSPWATPFTEYFPIMFFDPVIHTWDLAMAVGAEPVLDLDLVTAAVEMLEAEGEAFVKGGVMAAASTPTSDHPIDRLVAITGRG